MLNLCGSDDSDDYSDEIYVVRGRRPKRYRSLSKVNLRPTISTSSVRSEENVSEKPFFSTLSIPNKLKLLFASGLSFSRNTTGIPCGIDSENCVFDLNENANKLEKNFVEGFGTQDVSDGIKRVADNEGESTQSKKDSGASTRSTGSGANNGQSQANRAYPQKIGMMTGSNKAAKAKAMRFQKEKLERLQSKIKNVNVGNRKSWKVPKWQDGQQLEDDDDDDDEAPQDDAKKVPAATSTLTSKPPVPKPIVQGPPKIPPPPPEAPPKVPPPPPLVPPKVPPPPPEAPPKIPPPPPEAPPKIPPPPPESPPKISPPPPESPPKIPPPPPEAPPKVPPPHSEITPNAPPPPPEVPPNIPPPPPEVPQKIPSPPEDVPPKIPPPPPDVLPKVLESMWDLELRPVFLPRESIRSTIVKDDVPKIDDSESKEEFREVLEEMSDEEEEMSIKGSLESEPIEEPPLPEYRLEAPKKEPPVFNCMENVWMKLKEYFNHEIEAAIDISSNDDEDSLSVNDNDDYQMDTEWLELADSGLKDYPENLVPTFNTDNPNRLSSSKRLPGHHFPAKLLHCTLPIYTALLCLGRFPFEIHLTNDFPQYKFNRKSWKYFSFIGSSILIFLASLLMVINLVDIATAREPLTYHQTILQLEQDKFWLEGTLEVVGLIFIAISSISLLECGGGVFVADYLNRFSQSLCLIRYDVTSNLRKLICVALLALGIYTLVVIILFFAGGETVPTVRGMCGFIGTLILASFTSELRLRSGFPAVQYFGLFVHLYVTLAGGLITIAISSHCWALDNAAKRFNRRLSGCLSGPGFKSTKSSGNVVPYLKLFAEHLVVSSFPKQIGKILSTSFIAYSSCKTVEMVITLFGLTEPIVHGFAESEETYFNVSAQSHFDPDSIVPIRIVEPGHIISLKCGLYVARAWIPWFIFMEILHRPGSSIAQGAGLIIRNSYIKCKSQHALRFIASMKFSFSHRVEFHISPGIKITRVNVAKFMGFSIMILMTLLQFLPSESSNQGVLVCDHLGGCFYFQFPGKLRSRNDFQNAVGSVILTSTLQKDELKSKPQIPVTPNLKNFSYHFPPCTSNGRLPNHPSTYAIPRSPQGSPYAPIYFQELSGNFIGLPSNSDATSSTTELLDCFGEKVTSVETDECGNPYLANPDFQGNKRLPFLRAIRFNSSEIFCCYVYSGDLELQSKRCNLLSTENGYSCTRKSKTKNREVHEEYLRSNWKDELFATLCLCQGLDNIPEDEIICSSGREKNYNPISSTPASKVTLVTGASLRPTTARSTASIPTITTSISPRTKKSTTSVSTTTKSTTTTSTTTTKPTTTTRRTTTTRSPILPEGSCKDYFPTISPCTQFCRHEPRKIFRTHFLYECPLGGYNFTLPTIVTTPKGSLAEETFTFSQCTKQMTPIEIPQSGRSYQDCYGNIIKQNEWNDDCGTPMMYYPKRTNGKKRKPVMKLVLVQSASANKIQYLCCWNYDEWQDKRLHSSCNLYPGSDISKVCAIRRSQKAPASNSCDLSRMFDKDHENTHFRSQCKKGHCTN